MAAAAAALRHAARRLASQRLPALTRRAAVAEQPMRAGRPSRRLLHGGSSSAAGRTFALAEVQRRLLMAGRTCSRPFSSYHNGISYPMTFGEKAKKAIDVYDRVTLRLLRASVLFLKLTLFGAFVLDLCGPGYIPWFTRVVLGFEPLEEWQFPRRGEKGSQSESS